MRKNAPLLVAVALLLLPMLYMGSYLALLHREFTYTATTTGIIEVESRAEYQAGGSFAKTVYWPLEQIDRKVRPNRWTDSRYFPAR